MRRSECVAPRVSYSAVIRGDRRLRLREPAPEEKAEGEAEHDVSEGNGHDHRRHLEREEPDSHGLNSRRYAAQLSAIAREAKRIYSELPKVTELEQSILKTLGKK